MDQMEYLIANSFQQFQHERAVPAWCARIAEIEAELARAASGASASTSDGAAGTLQLGAAGAGVACALVCMHTSMQTGILRRHCHDRLQCPSLCHCLILRSPSVVDGASLHLQPRQKHPG
jgi:rRNA-processing arch domain